MRLPADVTSLDCELLQPGLDEIRQDLKFRVVSRSVCLDRHQTRGRIWLGAHLDFSWLGC